MELRNKKVLVLGAGRSGVASARFMAERGALVGLHDIKEIVNWTDDARGLKTKHNVQLFSGEVPPAFLDEVEVVVISPGIPTSTIPYYLAGRSNVEVIAEVELAYRFLKGRIVGVTGSNGKTTTTTLIGALLQNSGIERCVAGNIGVPLVGTVTHSTERTWTVVELSSFQLETIKDFHPAVAVCLNVTPNHLDRYDSFDRYTEAKKRLFINQTPEDVAILSADNEVTAGWERSLPAKVTLFSVTKELDEGLFLRGSDLICRANGKEITLASLERILLRGRHNIENVLAGLAAGLACGAELDSMRETLASFKGVEHRIEFVAEINGIQFYNDSKATSVDATAKALEALGDADSKVVLILGGQGKNAPYAPLNELIKQFVRRIITIGEDAANIEEQLAPYSGVTRADSMADAVRKAFETGVQGDRVLLAPACASFDMFSSFEERGRVFKDCVARLETRAAGCS